LCWVLAGFNRYSFTEYIVKKEGGMFNSFFLPPQKEGPPFPLPVYGAYRETDWYERDVKYKEK
jgi:hypothetical protein